MDYCWSFFEKVYIRGLSARLLNRKNTEPEHEYKRPSIQKKSRKQQKYQREREMEESIITCRSMATCESMLDMPVTSMKMIMFVRLLLKDLSQRWQALLVILVNLFMKELIICNHDESSMFLRVMACYFLILFILRL